MKVSCGGVGTTAQCVVLMDSGAQPPLSVKVKTHLQYITIQHIKALPRLPNIQALIAAASLLPKEQWECSVVVPTPVKTKERFDSESFSCHSERFGSTVAAPGESCRTQFDVVSFWPSEVDCGPPPHPPHTHMVWNKSSRVGAEVFYQCNYGYHNVGEGNVSVCAAAGLWEKPSVVCQGTVRSTFRIFLLLSFRFSLQGCIDLGACCLL